MESDYARIIATLLVVLTLMFLVIYMLKKLKLTKGLGNKHIKIINTVPIGTKERLILVEINNVTLLLGSTPTHIETLYTFNEGEPISHSISKKTFADQLANITPA